MVSQVVQNTVPYIVYLEITVGNVDRIFSEIEKFPGLSCARENDSCVAQGILCQLLSV